MKSFVIISITSFLWVTSLGGFFGPNGQVAAAGTGASASIQAIAFVTSPLGVTESGARLPLLQAPNNSSVIIHHISAAGESFRSFQIHQAAADNGLAPLSVVVPLTDLFDEIAQARILAGDNKPIIISIIYTEN